MLPPPPAIAAPVAMPAVPKTMNFDQAMTSAYDHRVALAKANRHLRDFGSWYETVRKQYANPPDVK